MLAALPFGLVYLIPLMLLFGLVWGGPWAFATPIFVYVLTPALEPVLGLAKGNRPEGERLSWLFDGWLVLWVPVQVACLVAVLGVVVAGDRPAWEVAGLVVSMGIVAGGGGINVAHELMHRPQRWAQALAEGLMTLSSYPHFCVEHVLGHHRRVATPEDPASARRGEVVYAFLTRTLAGGLRSAWHLERQRVAKKGIRTFSWADRRLRHGVLLAATYAAVALGFGWAGVAAFVVQSAVAVFLLEVINYVEHYGLSRRALGDGRYERVMPKHSWNSSHRLTGWYLFNLPRHADHHYLASRPYPALRHLDDSPQLPAGYATMMLVALVPPLWFAIMNPRVDAWNAHVAAEAPDPEPRGLPVSA